MLYRRMDEPPVTRRLARPRLAAWASIALVIGAALAPACAAAETLALVDVRIVDVERGRILAPRTVVIRDGRIGAIVRGSARLPHGARRIELANRYLVPGFVDAHVHLFNTATKRPPNDWALPLFVAHGVTAVREMAADEASLRVLARWREEIDAGRRIAPRIVAAGIPARGRDDPRAEVDAIARAGGEFVKVFSEFPPRALAPTAAAAREAGLMIVGHAPSRMSAVDAARAGLRVNEHLMQLFEACSGDEAAVIEKRRTLEGVALAEAIEAQASGLFARHSRGDCARTARTLARLGQAQVPTLVLLQPDRGAPASPRDDPLWPLLRADEQARWTRILAADPKVRGAALVPQWRSARRIVAQLDRARATILAGTDAPMPLIHPGRSLHDELALLVESGLSPAEALASATVAPSRVFGLDDSGRVAVGRRADLVVLEADPLRDIAHTRGIVAVVANGRWLDRAALDRLLAPPPG